MNSHRFSWAANMVRILFLILLLMRLTGDLVGLAPQVITGVFSLGDGGSGWQIARLAIDLGFLGLVFLRFHRIWVAPATFIWLTVQTVVSMENMCNSAAGLAPVLAAVGGGLFLALVIGRIFDWCGIRGRILVVCLASAGLPMFYLSMALFQQTRMLIDNAFFPLARNLIEADARRLNSVLVQNANRDLERLLGMKKQASGEVVIPLLHEEEYWARAASLGIPLTAATEVGLTRGSETLKLEFENLSVESLVDILAKKFSITYDGAPQAGQMNLQVKGINLEEILAQLREIPGLGIHWKNDVLVISPTADPGTASLRLVLGAEGTARNPGFAELAEACEGNDCQPAEISIKRGAKEHILKIYIPERENGRLARGVILAVNLESWVKTGLYRELKTEKYQVKICFPVTSENVQRTFENYLVVEKSGEVRPFFPKDLGVSFDIAFNSRNSMGTTSLDVFAPTAVPRLQEFPSLRSFQMRSPRGQQYVLENWFLPFCQASLFLSLDTDVIWQSLLSNQVKSVVYCLLAVLLAAFMSFIYSDRLSRPIQEITAAAAAIRDGKTGLRIPAQPGEAEIEQLAGALDLMAQRLTGRIDLANKELLAEKSRFEILLESTWEGIFLLSRDGRLLYANHAARQLIGAAGPEGDFCALLSGVGTEFQPPLPNPWSPDLVEFKTTFQLPCGSQGVRKILTLYIRSIGCETPGQGGIASGCIAVLRDITVEKEIDRMKSDFVSQVSHELRTPLTSIKAYTEMLLDEEVSDPESRRDYLRITYDEAERLTRLINDLLDIARIESGRRPLKLGELDLGTLTRDIAGILGAQIEKNRQTLTLSLPQTAVLLIGDGDLLKQAGLNLLSNASKYTPAGGHLEISVGRREDGRLLWKFSDTGIGLSAKDKDRIFNKFFRADSDIVRAAGGTGLGMTLVKNIVDLHQGEILVDSVYEKGSTFSVILPSGISE